MTAIAGSRDFGPLRAIHAGAGIADLNIEVSNMHIEVVGDDSISRQACTYAEYRLFAALPYVIDPARVRRSQMVLQRIDPGGCQSVTCSVIIELDSGDILRFYTTADHPYAAINRAIEQLRYNSRAKVSNFAESPL